GGEMDAHVSDSPVLAGLGSRRGGLPWWARYWSGPSTEQDASGAERLPGGEGVQGGPGFVEVDEAEADARAGAAPVEAAPVGLDHHGDDRVTAGDRVVGAEDDGFAGRGDLDRAPRHGGGAGAVVAGAGERGAGEAGAGPVAGGGDGEFGGGEGGEGRVAATEAVQVGASEDADGRVEIEGW